MCSVYTELLQLILITRQILASLHFNENVHREVKKKKNGEVRTRVWWPKFKAGEAVVRDVKVEPTYSKCHVFQEFVHDYQHFSQSYQVYHFLTPSPYPYCIPLKLVQESD
jgi:hypothetical protein